MLLIPSDRPRRGLSLAAPSNHPRRGLWLAVPSGRPRRGSWLALSLLLAGCAGELDDPDRFRVAQGGTAGDAGAAGDGGSGGGSAGDGGSGGTAGAGGAAGPCDAPKLVLQDKCATGCHSAASRLGGLDLQSDGLVERLRGVKGAICSGASLIDPDAPEKSALYDKTAAEPSCGGDRMPLTGDLLTDDERACLLSWLTSVAAP